MSKDIKYCAVGDYGVEWIANTQHECQHWINEQIENEDMEDDYYKIKEYTQAELDAMPEID